MGNTIENRGCLFIYLFVYSPLPERPRLSLRTINLIQSSMPVRKCISGEKSDIVLSNHNWRASVASETLTGVTQLKIGDVCLLASERSERDSIRGG